MKNIISPQTARIVSAPINEWETLLAKIDSEQAATITMELRAIIQRAALLDGYISRRRNFTGGDHGHAKAAQHANKTLAQIRKALGFAYPKQSGLKIS